MPHLSLLCVPPKDQVIFACSYTCSMCRGGTSETLVCYPVGGMIKGHMSRPGPLCRFRHFLIKWCVDVFSLSAGNTRWETNVDLNCNGPCLIPISFFPANCFGLCGFKSKYSCIEDRGSKTRFPLYTWHRCQCNSSSTKAHAHHGPNWPSSRIQWTNYLVLQYQLVWVIRA